jgi:hypothetical protein
VRPGGAMQQPVQSGWGSLSLAPRRDGPPRPRQPLRRIVALADDMLASVHDGGRVVVWDLNHEKSLTRYSVTDLTSTHDAVSVAPRGQTAFAHGNTVTVHNGSGRVVVHVPGVRAVALWEAAPGRLELATAAIEGNEMFLRTHDLRNPTVAREVVGLPAPVAVPWRRHVRLQHVSLPDNVAGGGAWLAVLQPRHARLYGRDADGAWAHMGEQTYGDHNFGLDDVRLDADGALHVAMIDREAALHHQAVYMCTTAPNVDAVVRVVEADSFARELEAVALLPDGRPVAIMDDGRLITTDMDGNRVIVPEALWERPPTRSRPRPDTAVAMAALPARDDGQQRVVVYGHHLPAPVVRTV